MDGNSYYFDGVFQLNGKTEPDLGGGTSLFSDFMNNVKDKRVVNVSISGAEISGVTTDGHNFTTYAPYSPTTVDTLLENNVKVEARPQDTSEDTLWNIIISWFPMVYSSACGCSLCGRPAPATIRL